MIGVPAEPIIISPIFKEKIWGGTALSSKLNKSTPAGKLFGESWEVCGFGEEQNIICSGRLAGKTLGQLFLDAKNDLVNDLPGETFPLLLKFIDANDNLSVQIHPDAHYAKSRGWGETGKTECWYVLDATANAQIIIGFKNQVSKDDIRSAVDRQKLHELLNYIDIKSGDVFYVPAGTVHAILGDALIYEVQEPSDLTLRLYDWGRTDDTGAMRQLHIDDSIEIADTIPHQYRIEPVTIDYGKYNHSYRVGCNFFALEEYRFFEKSVCELPLKKYFRLLSSVNGTAALHYQGGTTELRMGQTVVIPSVLRDISISGTAGTHLLCSSVPDLANEIVAPLLQKDISPAIVKKLGGFDEKNDLKQFLS